MSANNNTTAADRVEKKSIDEAIASFAMLVRCVVRFVTFCSFFWFFNVCCFFIPGKREEKATVFFF